MKSPSWQHTSRKYKISFKIVSRILCDFVSGFKTYIFLVVLKRSLNEVLKKRQNEVLKRSLNEGDIASFLTLFSLTYYSPVLLIYRFNL